jgi:hypothetical protein
VPQPIGVAAASRDELAMFSRGRNYACDGFVMDGKPIYFQ